MPGISADGFFYLFNDDSDDIGIIPPSISISHESEPMGALTFNVDELIPDGSVGQFTYEFGLNDFGEFTINRIDIEESRSSQWGSDPMNLMWLFHWSSPIKVTSQVICKTSRILENISDWIDEIFQEHYRW
jgi:hypothetical protein